MGCMVGVRLVIQAELPKDCQTYIHRSGGAASHFELTVWPTLFSTYRAWHGEKLCTTLACEEIHGQIARPHGGA